jgi:hypothetical protein
MISGKPCSMIGFEKRWSPQLTIDREAFVASFDEAPPKPAEMDAHVRVNRGSS